MKALTELQSVSKYLLKTADKIDLWPDYVSRWEHWHDTTVYWYWFIGEEINKMGDIHDSFKIRKY